VDTFSSVCTTFSFLVSLPSLSVLVMFMRFSGYVNGLALPLYRFHPHWVSVSCGGGVASLSLSLSLSLSRKVT
jgi:hypothetical protein